MQLETSPKSTRRRRSWLTCNDPSPELSTSNHHPPQIPSSPVTTRDGYNSAQIRNLSIDEQIRIRRNFSVGSKGLGIVPALREKTRMLGTQLTPPQYLKRC